jgi:hypothetical protein
MNIYYEILYQFIQFAAKLKTLSGVLFIMRTQVVVEIYVNCRNPLLRIHSKFFKLEVFIEDAIFLYDKF